MIELYSKEESLVNVSNSVLKAYGEKTFHPSLKELDEVFKNNDVPHRRVCFILLDGFGTSIQYVYRKSAPYIYSHRFKKITSVFPPTTVAATTSLLTGKYPYETGWMGWTEKFPDYKTPITMFPSTFIGGDNKSPKRTLDMVPIKHITDIISEGGKYKANCVMGFMDTIPGTQAFMDRVSISIKVNDFTYAYWTDPDATLHDYGVGSKEVSDVLIDIDEKVKTLIQNNPNVLFITLADHGHINCKYFSIYEHSDFYDCLSNPDFSNEPRASVFHVKEDKKEEFRRLAKKYYGKYFYVLSKDEVIKNKVFGFGEENPLFNYLAGDFLLIAKDSYALAESTTATNLISHHAGATVQERFINLGLYNSK